MANLEGLNPYIKAKTEQLIKNANPKLKSHTIIITQAFRSTAEQDKLYRQGRFGNPGSVVTNAKGGQSMHNYGLAIDFALKRKSDGEAVWNQNLDDWKTVVAEAKKLGFEWGGDWSRFKDYPHFQMLGNLEEREIRAGKKPVFPKDKVKYVYWDGSIMRKGQIGRLKILKPINLWERGEDDKLKNLRVLQPGTTYRVYGKDKEHGGQFNVGGAWVTDMKGYVKYETPSSDKLDQLEALYK